MSPEEALQRHLFEVASAAIAPVVVTAHPLPAQQLPFVHIGETDADDHPIGDTVRVTIHAWSKEHGPHEVRALQRALKVAIEAAPETAHGWTFTAIHENFRRCFLDADGNHWHGVQEISVIANSG